eukprot:26805_1
MKTSTIIISGGIVGLIVYLNGWFSWIYDREMNRGYKDSSTIRDNYNSWTSDGILEYYWGNHIHLGYYPNNTATNVDFRAAKKEMTFKLFEWAHQQTNRDINDCKDKTLIDMGCGFGGSTLSLTKKYELGEAIGITLSDGQVRRAKEILIEKQYTGNNVDYQVQDALNMPFKDQSFDIVWSLEMEPHIPDKDKMVNEMLRLLKPNGLLILGCWNIRDVSNENPLNEKDKKMIWFLENEWGHPNFWSIADYKTKFEKHKDVKDVKYDNWNKYTIPAWRESVWEMIRRPKMLFWCMLHPSTWNDRWGDLMGLLNMDNAFRSGLMEYGVFAVVKK